MEKYKIYTSVGDAQVVVKDGEIQNFVELKSKLSKLFDLTRLDIVGGFLRVWLEDSNYGDPEYKLFPED